MQLIKEADSHYFSKQSTKCIQGIQALYICMNQKCLRINPYFCPNQQCKCHYQHLQCKQLRLKVVRNKIQTQLKQKDQMRSKLQDSINQLFDNLIDILSDQREKLIIKIKQGESNWLLRYDLILEQMLKKQIKQEQLCGAIMSKLWNQVIFYQQSPPFDLQTILVQIQSSFFDFQTTKMTQLRGTLQSILFESTNLSSRNTAYGALGVDDGQYTVKHKLKNKKKKVKQLNQRNYNPYQYN